MCVVSMVMDHYGDEWRRRIVYQTEIGQPITQPITQEEIAEFRRLLDRAREYDRRNNEPDCEMESKKQTLLDMAKQLGIEISFL